MVRAMHRRLLARLGIGLTALLAAPAARAFPHVVRPGETLASIAEAVYGRIQLEQVLVAANELDVQGGLSIRPGMRLEVPAVTYRRARAGDTWAALAAETLGAERRSDVLAAVNGSSPWLPVEPGAELVLPYNLRLIATAPETLPQLAFRYLGDAKKAWMLGQYNGREGIEVARGEVLLIPLVDLPLTARGKQEAASAAAALASEALGETLRTQRRVAAELPQLLADVRAGRWVDAVRRGSGFLASGDLTDRQLATIHRKLVEAYVALGATGLAASACAALRKVEPGLRLDPNLTSPKVRLACEQGAE